MNDELTLRVTHVADAAEALGVQYGAGAGGLTWLGKPGSVAIGPAFTLQQRGIPFTPDAPKSRHGEAVTTMSKPGDVLVAAFDGETDGAIWGGAQALRAMGRGLAGVLTDGKVRDLDGLRELGFPVLCRTSTPFRSAGRMVTESVGSEVTLRGVRIRHGDTIVLDADGFMCLPADRAAEVIARARAIAEQEHVRDQQILAARHAGTA